MPDRNYFTLILIEDTNIHIAKKDKYSHTQLTTLICECKFKNNLNGKHDISQ